MRIPALVVLTLAVPLLACATPPKERALSRAVVLASNMCGRPGVQAASNDPKGERMFCEFEIPVGSHVPQCVCRDEQNIIADRENTQQYLRDMEHSACLNNGAGACSIAPTGPSR